MSSSGGFEAPAADAAAASDQPPPLDDDEIFRESAASTDHSPISSPQSSDQAPAFEATDEFSELPAAASDQNDEVENSTEWKSSTIDHSGDAGADQPPPLSEDDRPGLDHQDSAISDESVNVGGDEDEQRGKPEIAAISLIDEVKKSTERKSSSVDHSGDVGADQPPPLSKDDRPGSDHQDSADSASSDQAVDAGGDEDEQRGKPEIEAMSFSDYEIVEEDVSSPCEKNTTGFLRREPSSLPCTRSPSDGDDVRWYFCKAPLDLHEPAASMPKTEVVGKGDYFRFSVRDSLSLEESFLKREEELVALWWREYAECSEGPSKSKKLGEEDFESFKRLSSDSFEDAVGISVKGGLYEVDLDSRRCFPVYWGGEHRRVLRGQWFAQRGVDWLPLREDIAEQLEFAYRSKIWLRRSFQPSGQFAARLDFQGATQGLHALFTGEEDTWEAWLNVDKSGISSMFGLTGTGFKLRRGFTISDTSHLSQDEARQKKEEEMDDYCSEVPVKHLVFMVHGIGQRLEKANLVDDVGTFRRIVATLAEKHLTDYQRRSQRVLFIPCQWRRHLKLGGEAAVENCTLEGVRALRTMIGATVHDVLYYMSPIYCQDIIDSVSSSLNMLYKKFMRRNPGYDGKISLYGHSLGSVLSYDILCHQEALTALFPIQEINLNVSKEDDGGELSSDDASCVEEHVSSIDGENPASIEEERNIKSLEAEVSVLRAKLKTLECSGTQQPEQLPSLPSRRHHTPRITYTKLQFQVDTFYAVGSPLGLFLGLRNVRLGTGSGHDYWEDECIEEEMPACRQMMNIFHPYDPVAYRVEPLVSKEYVQKRPVFIPYHKGGKRLHIGMQELGEDLGARSRAFVSSIASVGSRVASAFSAADTKSEEDSQRKEERSYGSLVMERLTGSPDGRVDYMLQDSTFEHQYISAISSHTNYWRDLDTALFILRHLYSELPEESPSKVRAEEEARNRLLVEFGGYIENDIPLTFSSKEGIAAEMAAGEKTCCTSNRVVV